MIYYRGVFPSDFWGVWYQTGCCRKSCLISTIFDYFLRGFLVLAYVNVLGFFVGFMFGI